MEKEVRLLKAEEIECRVGIINEKGLSLLLYKDARADMKILDEVYGPLGWQRRHEMVGGNLYCIVSVWDEEKQQWISKMDVGTESYTEKEKGQASDSFKRACVNLGIGRELYKAPFLWIAASKINLQKKQDGKTEKYYTYDKFFVQSISYNDNREITGLTIVNQDGKEVYSLKEKGGVVQEAEKPERIAATSKRQAGTALDREQEIGKELARTGVALDAVLERYGVSSIQEMDSSTYRKAVNSLKKTKAKAA